jgi:hypothetical protein
MLVNTHADVCIYSLDCVTILWMTFFLRLQNPSQCDIYTEHSTHTTCAAYAPTGFYIASGGRSPPFLVHHRLCPRGLLVYSWSVRQSVHQSVIPPPVSAVDKDIQLKFDTWLYLGEFQYVLPTFDSILRPLMNEKNQFSALFSTLLDKNTELKFDMHLCVG